MPTRKPKAPPHLKPETAAWWSEVVESWTLDSHHVRLLTLACETWDRCQEARETLKKQKPYYKDRFGQPKEHPAVAVERNSQIAFARLVRELDLDGEPAPDPRPPRRGR